MKDTNQEFIESVRCHVARFTCTCVLQIKHILACADLYFSHMTKLQQEREEIKQKLKQSDVAKPRLLNDTGGWTEWLVCLYCYHCIHMWWSMSLL